MDVWGFIVVMLICGGISAAIGTSKNHNGLLSFLAGAVLGIIGIVIVAVAPRGKPPAPAGMRSVQCLRCNAVQNIPVSGTGFTCWQCGMSNTVPLASGVLPNGTQKSEDMEEWLNRVRRDDKFL